MAEERYSAARLEFQSVVGAGSTREPAVATEEWEVEGAVGSWDNSVKRKLMNQSSQPFRYHAQCTFDRSGRIAYNVCLELLCRNGQQCHE
jgi:hypothetical protein